ncbi:MAG: aspartate aminotransferase family protein [Candidatus Omnitrophica bacterium]|nr:aspartate aminotransferase family protein [Candidatus Omnitrophota bacterium]
MDSMEHIKDMYGKYVLSTYTRQELCIIKGEGVWVEDITGKKYLDFFPGWAVSGIGHCHPKVVRRIREQLDRILHVSNNFYNELQPLLAAKIISHSFPGKVFFANSGAEANEGAIKLARRYGNPGRYEIITMEGSFHGRTLATLTATGQEKVKTGFAPLVQGFKHVPFNDISAFRAAVSEKTVAVIIEPIQGEGGINVADGEYMRSLRDICREKDILFIVDEVQTCMGRTGSMFAYQQYGIEPDAMTLAKSLGGGLPLGALVVNDAHKDVLPPGSHATTFGGSPIVCAAGLGVFEAIEADGLVENAAAMGQYLVDKLTGLKRENPVIGNIRGKGLMIGVEIGMDDASVIAEECLKGGLLINCTQKNILRIMPPVTVQKDDIDMAMERLGQALRKAGKKT